MTPLYKPYISENLPELESILKSGNLAYGPYSRAFENALAKFLNQDNVLLVNSYSSALLTVIATLGIKAGDEVILSPMSCLASNQPFAIMGVNVVWADILPDRGTLDPIDVERKITSKTKAIIHNHYCGYVGKIKEINNIGKKYRIPVIDDSIEAFGSIYQEQYIGNVKTDITVFSFETIRMPNCICAGAIVFESRALFEKAKLIIDLGVNRETFRDDIGEINANSDIKHAGLGCKISEINSYFGLKHLEVIESQLAQQKINADKWMNFFSENSRKATPISLVEESIPNYWVFGVLAENKREFIIDMRAKGHYASGVHINNNIYSVFGRSAELKGVEEFNSKFVALPSGWWIK